MSRTVLGLMAGFVWLTVFFLSPGVGVWELFVVGGGYVIFATFLDILRGRWRRPSVREASILGLAFLWAGLVVALKAYVPGLAQFVDRFIPPGFVLGWAALPLAVGVSLRVQALVRKWRTDLRP